jgi:single-strand DNA-binding protein
MLKQKKKKLKKQKPMIKLSGKIKKVFNTETFNTFEKRTFWLEDVSEKYPNTWQLELWTSDIDMIDHYSVGDFVTVYIDIKGKFWSRDGKEGVMNTLKCWNIEKEGKPFKEIKA